MVSASSPDNVITGYSGNKHVSNQKQEQSFKTPLCGYERPVVVDDDRCHSGDMNTGINSTEITNSNVMWSEENAQPTLGSIKEVSNIVKNGESFTGPEVLNHAQQRTHKSCRLHRVKEGCNTLHHGAPPEPALGAHNEDKSCRLHRVKEGCNTLHQGGPPEPVLGAQNGDHELPNENASSVYTVVPLEEKISVNKGSLQDNKFSLSSNCGHFQNNSDSQDLLSPDNFPQSRGRQFRRHSVGSSVLSEGKLLLSSRDDSRHVLSQGCSHVNTTSTSTGACPRIPAIVGLEHPPPHPPLLLPPLLIIIIIISIIGYIICCLWIPTL